MTTEVGKMFRNGGVLLSIAFAIAVLNWILDLLRIAFGVIGKSPITPFVSLFICIVGICAGANYFGKMTDGSNFIIKNSNSFAFSALLGTAIFAVPLAAHFRFWMLGVIVGLVAAVSMVVLPKYATSKWAKVFAGFLTVSLFCFAMWYSGEVWYISAKLFALYSILIAAHIGNFWHILSTTSAAACSFWTLWIWSKKLP